VPEPIEAVVFDAYGTLFDVHSVIQRCDQLFPRRGEELSRLWRSKQLEYTWLRSLMGQYENFESITQAALTFSCHALRLPLSAASANALMGDYRHLLAYADAPSALKDLAPRKLAILSNGSPEMLQAVVRNAGLQPLFQAVISVDPLHIYKPHPSVYQLAVDRLEVSKERIAFISSNFWDVTGATSFGFRAVWINRSGAQADELGYHPAAILDGLDELSSALEEL
jgi:2-haloacid dehalogenase